MVLPGSCPAAAWSWTAGRSVSALAAVAADGDRLGPPLVTAVEARLQPGELPSALERRYQVLLESLNAMRRRVAAAAMLRKNIERQLTGSEPLQDTAGLRKRLAAATEAEEQLTAASQREQMEADALRTRKEVLKAAYTVAWAEQLIEQAQAADAGIVPQGDPGGAAARLEEITGQIEEELSEAPAEGLLELRPGPAAGGSLRILFAVEPPGTALLVAVLEGDDAVRDHYRDAVVLASEVLHEARVGQAPEAAARTFGDAQSFLAEFFPGRVDELRSAAAVLAAANRSGPA